jgi:serine/threonine-protein kinase
LTVLAIAMTAASFAIAWWFDRTVTTANTRLVDRSLHAVQSASVRSFQQWLDQEIAAAVDTVAKGSVQKDAIELIAEATQDFQWDASDTEDLASFESLRQSLDSSSEHSDGYVGWCVCAINRLIVASSKTQWVGQSLPITVELQQSLLLAESSYCSPIQLPGIQKPGKTGAMNDWLCGPVTPVRHDGEVIGFLMLISKPSEKLAGLFADSLADTNASTSLETYAFDRDARMLNQSRFESQLRRLDEHLSGRSDDRWSELAIRDPGGDVLLGWKPLLPVAKRPLTLMADRATRGDSGSTFTRYRNYRGVNVVGAWQWLPEYDLGIATEIEWRDAMSPAVLTRRLGYASAGLVSLIFFGAIAVRFLKRWSGRSSRWRRKQLIRDRLGNYDIGELIGSGGMGSVYLGTHQHLRRPVAIKVLTTDDLHSESPSSRDEHSIARFEREVRLTASLRHPNTIEVYDYGRSDDGTFFYVMEYVEGLSLQQLVDVFGAQPPARVIHLLLQICGSLAEAHGMGLVHRDIKPANLLLSNQGGVNDWIKVLDFGLIKNMILPAEEPSLTHSDTVTGTPMYMSPECVRDASSSNSLSDLYSVGAVGYALLTGKPIFDGGGTVEICMKQLKDDPVRPDKRLGGTLPEDLQNVLMSCLRKDPADRPRDMQDLASALRSCDDASSWSEADATHWWEVVYAKRASEMESKTLLAGNPALAKATEKSKLDTVNTRNP